jgi:O-antigen/teichoic acid export membrane protein
VPLTVDILGAEKYGIWLTIYSIVNWFNSFDMGLGNGFRNKFTESLAVNDLELSIKYVQTLYASIGLISIVLVGVYFIVSPFLDWVNILNISSHFDEDLDNVIGSVFILFFVQLWLKNISTILLAFQKSAVASLVNLFISIFSLVTILALNYFKLANLFTISIAFMIVPVLVYLFATLFAFRTFMKEFKFDILYLPNSILFKELIGLGSKFLIINIATVVLFSSSNLVISRLFGPAFVTPYNIAYQLFFTLLSFFSILTAPFWSAFTDAFAKKEFEWMISSVKSLIKSWYFFALIVLLIWLLSPIIFRIWLGGEIVISKWLSLQFAIFTLLMSWSSIFSMYLAGIGKIKLSLYGAIVQCFFNIPLAIYFAKTLNLNSVGVILALNLVMLFGVILLTMQARRIMHGRAVGIWNE